MSDIYYETEWTNTPQPDPGCRRGNNPYGHPVDCPCRRASQSIPYNGPDDPEFPDAA